MRFPWGLRDRAVALCVALVLATAGALGSALIWQNYNASLAQLRTHATVQVRATSRLAEPAVLLNDREAVESILKAATLDANVARAVLLDDHGRPLGMSQPSLRLAESAVADPAALFPKPLDRSAVAVQQGRKHLQVTVPIWRESKSIDPEFGENDQAPTVGEDRPIGYVMLTFKLEGIQRELRNRILGSVAVAAAVILAGLGATLIGVRQMLLPLWDLVATSRAIAEGNRSVRAQERAVGELGELAATFNHMADRVEQSYAEIERKVVERTAELESRQHQLEGEITERQRAEAQLRLAKEAAEAASRAKSDFLANMSHEIRTPLTAILGFTESLLDADLAASERAQAVATVRRNGEHLLQIIGDILDISKIESGQMQLEQLTCCPTQVVHEVDSLMRPRALQKGLSLRVELAGPIPELIRTDPTRLRQILINLVSNAIKFTARGGVSLRVGLAAADPPASADQRPRLCFAVEDSGIGMAAEQLARVFQPFTQADETMTRRFGGTGLGLAISRRLAEMLGGTITVTSTPGVGSTFVLTIAADPVSADQSARTGAPPAPRQGSAACAPAPSADGLAGRRVLLAEDGEDNQRLISFILRKAGAEVTVVGNGQLAVDAVAGATTLGVRWDVILMDMQMPVLDGYDATRQLRRQGYTGAIVALTAHAMSGERERCLAAGCDDYASKPIDRTRLIDLLSRHCAAGQSAAARPASTAKPAPPGGDHPPVSPGPN